MSLKPFTTEDWLAYLEAYKDSHLYEWLVSQAKRSVEYFGNRLDRLGMRGGRVLDAGCGAGNWAVALASRFDKVDAIDNDRERVAILDGMIPLLGGQVETAIGSTEELPYPDDTFDVVFCSGVIFVVDYQKSLAEFLRVLKPGGTLYASFVGATWWRHVLYERSKTEPVCIQYGANGLVSLYFRRLDEINLQERISSGLREDVLALLSPQQPSGWWKKPAKVPASDVLDRFREADQIDPAQERALLAMLKQALQQIEGSQREKCKAQDAIHTLDDLCWDQVPPSYRRRILVDFVSRALLRVPDYKYDIHTYTFDPEDMSEVLADLGFSSIEIAAEGVLSVCTGVPDAPALYLRRLGVFEFLCTKGAPLVTIRASS